MKKSFLFLLITFIAQYADAQSTGTLESSMYPQSSQNQSGSDVKATGKFATTVDFSGNTNTEMLNDLIAENNKFGRVVTIDNNRQQILNRVYLFDTNQGITRVYTKDGKGYKVPNANFNLDSNQLEVPLENNQVFAFDLSNVSFFEKLNRKFTFSNETNSLQEVLLENERVNLIKIYKIETKSAAINPLTNEVTKPAYSIKKVEYYMQFGDVMIEVPNSKRKFLKSLPEKEIEVEKFMRDNKLDFSNEDNLKIILNFYANS